MMKTYAVIEGGVVANVAAGEDAMADNWVEAPAEVGIGWSYDGHSFAPPIAEVEVQVLPDEVPRYCGLLALKRHRMAAGLLQELGESEDWQEGGSLHAQVLAYRAAMAAGVARDRLDVALNDVLSWTRTSPTVADLCAVLQLTDAHRDALFVWAKSQEAAI